MIDREKFQDYFQYYDRETVIEIIDIFIREYPGRMQKIRDNITGKHFEELRFNVHSLKGVVASFMDPVASGCVLKLEELARNSDGNGLEEAYSEMVAAIGNTFQDLQEIRKTL